jgi:uncharacterized Zn-finger protein
MYSGEHAPKDSIPVDLSGGRDTQGLMEAPLLWSRQVGSSQGAGKRFQCQFCEKGFDGSRGLERHLRAHIGERPFSCSLCGKAFSTRWNMTQHAKTHECDKLYSCPVCGKSFKQSAGLSNHLRQHRKV